MKIIENYPETLDKKTAFKMTEEEAIKLTECEGQELQVDAYVLYEDVNAKGEEVTLSARSIISIANGLQDVVLPTCKMKIANNLIVIKE